VPEKRLMRSIGVLLTRVGVVILELIAEALLLGVLLGLLIVPIKFAALAVGALPVILVLFMHGYYFTRPVLGLLWRGARSWLYALVAAALFTIHMAIGYARLRPDMMQVRTWVVITFFAGGATIVFVCALVGRRWLVHLRS
jgi:hypothetical protein